MFKMRQLLLQAALVACVLTGLEGAAAYGTQRNLWYDRVLNRPISDYYRPRTSQWRAVNLDPLQADYPAAWSDLPPKPAYESDDRVTQQTLKPLRDYISGQLQANPALIAKYVRIGFHSCLNQEGCQGCLDPADVHNGGVKDVYSSLKNWYDQNSPKLSFADFIALAAIEAVNLGIHNARCRNQPCTHKVEFRMGRKTCSDPRNPPAADFTDGDKLGGLDALQRIFSLSRREAIALLGFHSLGRCAFSISGFDGAWDDQPNAADNGYFRHLSNDTFAVNTALAAIQWNDPQKHLFLQSDVEAKHTILLNADGKPTCSTNIKNCPLSSTSYLVDYYATSTSAWLNDAVPTFTKMIEKTAHRLQYVPDY